MTSRSSLFAVLLAVAFAGCTCVTPSQTVSYSCATGEDCPPNEQCCADQRCRASCQPPPTACSPACDAGYQCSDAGTCERACEPACAQGQLCSAGTCVDARCQPACADGLTCTDAGTCDDLRCQSVTCASGQRCEQGQCVCAAGGPCSGNAGAPCRQGVVTCVSGQSSCSDGPAGPDGLECPDAGVCSAGACVPCTDGLPCDQNPDLCRVGRLTCGSTGTPVCDDSRKARPAGSQCGVDLVCDGDGGCRSCVSGQSCSSKTACHRAAISCTDGSPNCLDVGILDAGAPCPGGVCSPGAICLTCAAGSSCTGNPDPCREGTQDCTGGVVRCADGAPRPPGYSCGTNQFCDSAGSCTACTPGSPCTNPGSCLAGFRVCSNGSSSCMNTTTPLPPNAPCGTGLVCNGMGACVSCPAGVLCMTNPTPCRPGVVSCATGAAQCVDGPGALPVGTTCGAGAQCNQVGTCGGCLNMQPCPTNPSRCLLGLSKCSPSAQCVDDAPAPVGTPCGAGLVCNGSDGGCISCAQGAPCNTNPNRCLRGITDCVGFAKCLDNGTPVPDGTTCASDAGPWDTCLGSPADPCSSVGLQSREHLDVRCSSGVCNQQVMTVETRSCTTASTDGVICGPPAPSGFPTACGAPDACASLGTQLQSMTAFVCSGGACTGVDGGTTTVPCPVTPTGCYLGGVCHDGTQPPACGTGGAMCQVCGFLGRCIAHTCSG